MCLRVLSFSHWVTSGKPYEYQERYSKIAKVEDMVDQEGDGRECGNLINTLISDCGKPSSVTKSIRRLQKIWLTRKEKIMEISLML